MATRDQDGTPKNPGQDEGHENRDPLSGERGAHPVGTGMGAAAAGAAGAAIGAAAGPLGAIVGAAVGAVAGGLGGKAAAEAVNPTLEDRHWREAYKGRPYVASGSPYEQYQPAYRFGWESRLLHNDRRWDEVEPQLAERWTERREGSTLPWEHARDAAHDAWHRLSHRTGSAGEEASAAGATEAEPLSAGPDGGRSGREGADRGRPARDQPARGEDEEPVLDLETSESNLEQPDPRLDTTGKGGSPDAGANGRREDDTLH